MAKKRLPKQAIDRLKKKFIHKDKTKYNRTKEKRRKDDNNERPKTQ